MYRAGLDIAYPSLSCFRNGGCDLCLCSVGNLIKLRTREVDGHLSYTENGSFGGCSLTGILYIFFTVTCHQSFLVLFVQ